MEVTRTRCARRHSGTRNGTISAMFSDSEHAVRSSYPDRRCCCFFCCCNYRHHHVTRAESSDECNIYVIITRIDGHNLTSSNGFETRPAHAQGRRDATTGSGNEADGVTCKSRHRTVSMSETVHSLSNFLFLFFLHPKRRREKRWRSK